MITRKGQYNRVRKNADEHRARADTLEAALHKLDEEMNIKLTEALRIIREQQAQIKQLNAEINVKADWNMKYLEHIEKLEAELTTTRGLCVSSNAEAGQVAKLKEKIDILNGLLGNTKNKTLDKT